MSIKKRVLTLVLAMAMVIGSAFSVYAATGSPTNPGFVAKTNHDVNTQDHGKKATVSTHVGNTVKVVYKIEAKTGTSSARPRLTAYVLPSLLPSFAWREPK